MKAMANNKYNFWGEICDIFVQNMVRFSSHAIGQMLLYKIHAIRRFGEHTSVHFYASYK
jgi:hypothetical protein